MICARCGQQLGLVSYVVTVYVRDDPVEEVAICSSCGGPIGDAQTRTTRELEP